MLTHNNKANLQKSTTHTHNNTGTYVNDQINKVGEEDYDMTDVSGGGTAAGTGTGT